MKPWPTFVLVMGSVIGIWLSVGAATQLVRSGWAPPEGEVRVTATVVATEYDPRVHRIEVSVPGAGTHRTIYYNGSPQVGDTLLMSHPADGMDPLVEVGYEVPRKAVWVAIIAVIMAFTMGATCLWFLVRRVRNRVIMARARP